MSAGTPIFSSEQFARRLAPFRRRAMSVDAGTLSLLFAAAVLFAILFLLWFDTVWALPVAVRWVATRGGILMAILAFVLGLIWKFRQITNERIANRIDQSTGSGGEILAGWQLASRPVHPASPVSQGFAAIAAQRAAERLQSIAPSVVAKSETLQKPAMILLAVVAIAGTVAAIVPQVAWHQMQRFLFPTTDIPPYTGIDIELVLEKESVLYGQDAMVRANVLFGKVERMTLVIESANAKEQTVPMLAQNEVEWQSLLSRVTEPLKVYARSGSSRSRKHQLNVQMTPQILSPKVTITPPEYTKTSPYRGPIPEQGISGLVGTQVEWSVSSNRPLKNGRLSLRYRNGEQELIELKPSLDVSGKTTEERSTVSAEFQLSQPSQFELSVVDVDGIESQDRVTGSIVISQDQRPIVRIVQPQPLSIATPDVNLPVSVIAEDDYGISSLSLYRSLNGSPAIPSLADLESTARVQHGWNLPLATFGLEPGDEIQLFARTEDNDPSGAKGAESPVTTIRIISVEAFQEMMVQQRGAESIQAKYQMARRYMDQLTSALREADEAAEALKANPESAEAAENLQKKMEAAKQAADQAAREIEKLGEQAMPIDVDQQLAETLKEMSEQAKEMADAIQEMKENAKPTLDDQEQEQLQEMIKKASGMQQELTEDAIDPLGTMQKMLPLMVDQQRFEQLVEQQKDLAQRMKGLQSSDPNDRATQRRVAELESEQEQLKQQLEQLLGDIEDHALDLAEDSDLEKLRDTALQFADAVRDSQADKTMVQAQQQLMQDAFPDAQSSAQQAAEILEKFLNQSQGMGDKACKNCEAAFNPGGTKMGNSMQQMMEMMGMKGRSGMKPGGKPGMGMGFGAGGGYSQRTAGPQNVGMYGSMPTPQNSPSRGKGDRQSQGVQTSKAIDTNAGGSAQKETIAKGESSGQSMNSIPATYRSKVADYLRNLSDQIGTAETKE